MIELLLVILGLITASLINDLSDVLPRRQNVFHVTCSKCNTTYSWRSYLLYQPCSNCHHPRSIRSKLIVGWLPIAFILLYHFPHDELNFWLSALLISYFTLIFIIDLENRLILNVTSLFGLALSVLIGLQLHGILPTILGALAGFAIMFAFYLFGILFMKFINKRRDVPSDEVALGFGDVTLATVLGALLGWPGITAGILLAIVLGGVASMISILIRAIRRKYEALYALPYAPFLILSAVFLLFR